MRACRKLAKSFDSSERAVRTWKPYSSWTGKYFEIILFLEGRNVFFNLTTGNRQSLTFQSLLITADALPIINCSYKLKQREKLKNTTLQSKDSLISGKMRWAKLDSFNPSLCRLSIISFALCQAHSTCQNSLTGSLCCSLKANCKVTHFTLL